MPHSMFLSSITVTARTTARDRGAPAPHGSPVSSPSTACTWSSSSFRSSSFRATLRSSRGQASSSEVVFNMISPRGVVTGDWINCREKRVLSRLSDRRRYKEDRGTLNLKVPPRTESRRHGPHRSGLTVHSGTFCSHSQCILILEILTMNTISFTPNVTIFLHIRIPNRALVT